MNAPITVADTKTARPAAGQMNIGVRLAAATARPTTAISSAAAATPCEDVRRVDQAVIAPLRCAAAPVGRHAAKPE